MRGTIAEAEIRCLAAFQFHGRAPRDDFLDAVFGQLERRPWTHDLAADRRIVRGLGRLLLVRVEHDEIDEMARHAHVMRAQ
jgi:hypothetical protein